MAALAEASPNISAALELSPDPLLEAAQSLIASFLGPDGATLDPLSLTRAVKLITWLGPRSGPRLGLLEVLEQLMVCSRTLQVTLFLLCFPSSVAACLLSLML